MSDHMDPRKRDAREQARLSDGRFGTQPHDKATGVGLAPAPLSPEQMEHLADELEGTSGFPESFEVDGDTLRVYPSLDEETPFGRDCKRKGLDVEIRIGPDGSYEAVPSLQGDDGDSIEAESWSGGPGSVEMTPAGVSRFFDEEFNGDGAAQDIADVARDGLVDRARGPHADAEDAYFEAIQGYRSYSSR